MAKKHKAEILAPAGSTEAFIAAVRTGCDAVYIGVRKFSARQKAKNFDRDELFEVCKIAHKNGIKVYLTINTLMFDDQLEEYMMLLDTAGQAGVDAILIQDLGAYNIAKKVMPDMPLHTSTQMSIHSKRGTLLAKEMGFERAVIAREMSKNQLQEVCNNGIEIEAFVHGALCACLSGQCYMSAMIGSRSANRGMCAQFCRMPVSTDENVQDKYALSMKDLSYVNHVRELEEMGVCSLKIEGRMKRPEYVAAAVTACRQALEGEIPDTQLLKAVFSRDGFTDGYYTGKMNHMFGVRTKEDAEISSSVLPKIHELYRKERARIGIKMKLTLKHGQNTELIVADEDGDGVRVEADPPQVALNHATTVESAQKQLSRLGSTIYYLDGFLADIDSIAMFPPSQLNELRRMACDMLDEIRINKNTKVKNIEEIKLRFDKKYSIKLLMMRAKIRKATQLENINPNVLEKVISPIDEVESVIAMGVSKEKIILSLPRYVANEQRLFDALAEKKNQGFTAIECQNIAHIQIGRELGLEMYGGFGLNITNSYAMKTLEELGIKDATVSFELKLGQIKDLADNLPYGIIAYGKLPLMLNVNCPIRSSVGCKNCTKKLIDRKGKEMLVECHNKEYVEIYNSDTLYLADKLGDVNGVSFITLNFTDETAEEVASIINKYQNGKSSGEKTITRGLYYRGIL